jgi:hypothetical protein
MLRGTVQFYLQWWGSGGRGRGRKRRRRKEEEEKEEGAWETGVRELQQQYYYLPS